PTASMPGPDGYSPLPDTSTESRGRRTAAGSCSRGGALTSGCSSARPGGGSSPTRGSPDSSAGSRSRASRAGAADTDQARVVRGARDPLAAEYPALLIQDRQRAAPERRRDHAPERVLDVVGADLDRHLAE